MYWDRVHLLQGTRSCVCVPYKSRHIKPEEWNWRAWADLCLKIKKCWWGMICRTFPRILSLKRMPPIIEVGSTLHLFTQRVHFLFNITFVRCRADRKFILTSIVCVLTGGCSKRPDCQSVDWPSGWGHRWQRWREGRQRASHRIEPWCCLTGRETCNRLCQLEAVLKTSAVWVWPIRSGIL